MTTMKLLLLPEDLYSYLLFVFEQHVRGGIESKQLPLAHGLNTQLLNAATVDYSHLGGAKLKLNPNGGVSLEIPNPPATPASDDSVPEQER